MVGFEIALGRVGTSRSGAKFRRAIRSDSLSENSFVDRFRTKVGSPLRQGGATHAEGTSIKIGDFQVESLAPGVQLYVCPTEKFKTTTVKVFIHRPLDDLASPTALLPFVLRRGCQKWPSMRLITQELEQLYGATLGVDTLKMGERQVLCFRLDLLGERFRRGKGSTVGRGLDFLTQLIWHPLSFDGRSFPSDAFESERRNLRRVVESLFDQKIQYATERLIQEMCRGEPFATYEYGHLEGIAQISNDSTYAFYQRILATAPIDIFVIGDVDPADIRCHLNALIPLSFRGERIDEIPPVVRKRPGRPKIVIEERDVSQAKLVMGYRTTVTPDSPQFPALLLVNLILGGGTFSKLFKNVRERHQMAYYASSSLERMKGILFVQSGIESSRFEAAVDVVRKQFADMKAGRIDDDELNGARKALLNRHKTAADSPGRMINDALEAVLSNRRPSARSIRNILRAVSRDDVIEAAKSLRLDMSYLLREPSKKKSSKKRKPRSPSPAAARQERS